MLQGKSKAELLAEYRAGHGDIERLADELFQAGREQGLQEGLDVMRVRNEQGLERLQRAVSPDVRKKVELYLVGGGAR